jgi:ferredoxin
MSICRCKDCGVELDKEKVDNWNIKQSNLDPVEQKITADANCPICFSSKDLKVWRYEK